MPFQGGSCVLVLKQSESGGAKRRGDDKTRSAPPPCLHATRQGALRPASAVRQLRHSAPSMSRRVSVRRIQPQAALEAGQPLSDYSDYYRVLKGSDGKAYALSNFKDKSPVVLFFYPKAGTPGCTKQACSFRDSYAVFQDAGAEVFGISSDSPDANAAFAKAQRLPFPLLTDQGDFLRKDFGIKPDLFGVLPGRQTYVIDKNGVCQLSFNSQFEPEKHMDEALKVIKRIA